MVLRSSSLARSRSGMDFKQRMRRAGFSAALLVLALLCRSPGGACYPGHDDSAASPRVTASQWRVTTPGKIEWQPAKLLPPGAQMALIEGDPSKPEFFTMRL